MTKRKQGAIYDKWHRRVEGQIKDVMLHHPEWFNIADEEAKKWCINSLAKRIVGEIVADIRLVTSDDGMAPKCADHQKDDGERIMSSSRDGVVSHCSVSDTQEERLPRLWEVVKVCLPGETPFAICLEVRENSWMGCIINKLFREYSEHEQAQFTSANFGEATPLPEKHQYKKFDVIEFIATPYKFRGGIGWEPKL